MSKGLEGIRNPIGCEFDVECKKFVYLKEQVDIIEKELRAFNIIKDKKVNVSLLSCSEWLDFYNQEIAYKEKELTQEEYELLKEVLL